MTLGWLAPAALGLLALIAGPLLVHLVRRNPRQRIPFGAMLLLRRLQQQLKRKRRIHDWLLLLLRILAVAAFVGTAAQPELRWPSAESDLQRATSVVVVIDDSLSMDQVFPGTEDTVFSRAKAEAISFIQRLPKDAKVGAVRVGGAAEALTHELGEDRSLALASLSELRQSHGGTDLVGGIRLARQLLEGKGGEVFVFTDEAGPTAVDATREEIALLSSQKGALVPKVFRPELPGNIRILQAKYGEGLEGGIVRFTAMNYGAESVDVPCTARLPDGTEITAFVQLPPQESVEAFVTVPRVTEGGVGVITVKDSSLDLDNSFYFHLPRIGASRVLIIDGDPGVTAFASEVYFLERSLSPWGGGSGMLPDVVGPAGISLLEPEEHRVVFMSNVSEPSPLASHLVQFVRDGGGLVITVGNNVTPERYNTALSELLPAELRKVQPLVSLHEPGKKTELPDVKLPLFEPFLRAGLRSFGLIRWKRLYALEKTAPDVETLLRLENGMPLLLSRRVGKGKVMLLTGSIDMSWGNLPIQSVFMPLMQRLVSELGGTSSVGAERFSGTVGEPMSIPLPDGADELSVEGPDGSVGVRFHDGQARFVPQTPGAYRVHSPGGPTLAWTAINHDPGESDVRPGPSLLETAAEVDPERFLKKASLSPYLLLLALLVGLLQAWLGYPKEEVPDAQT